MITLPEAFRKFKSRLELNEKEQANASKRQKEVRTYLDTKFQINRSFLTGSYARWTKAKPLKDGDIFFPNSAFSADLLTSFHPIFIEDYDFLADSNATLIFSADLAQSIRYFFRIL